MEGYKLPANIYKILFYLLAICLALGPHNPFYLHEITITTPENNFFTTFLCIIIILVALIFKDFSKSILAFKIDVCLLLTVACILFISSYIYALYNVALYTINIKFISVIFLYTLFAYLFIKNGSMVYKVIMIFSITLFTISLLVCFDFFPSTAVQKSLNSRLNLFGENPNSYSIRYVLGVLSLLYLVFENPLRISSKRYLLLGCIPTMMYIIIISGSRGSFIIALLGIVLFIFFSPLSKKIKQILFVFGILFLCLLLYKVTQNPYLYNRLIVSVIDGETAGRTTIWMQALSLFYNNPILGVGEYGYHEQMIRLFGEHRDTHNLFIYLLVCGGVFAIVVFSIFILRLLFSSFRHVRKSLFPFAIIVSLLLLMSKTGGVLTFLIMWFYMSVSISILKK